MVGIVVSILLIFEINLMEELNMKPFHEYMNEYKKQLKKGDIKEAYKGLNTMTLEFTNFVGIFSGMSSSLILSRETTWSFFSLLIIIELSWIIY